MGRQGHWQRKLFGGRAQGRVAGGDLPGALLAKAWLPPSFGKCMLALVVAACKWCSGVGALDEVKLLAYSDTD